MIKSLWGVVYLVIVAFTAPSFADESDETERFNTAYTLYQEAVRKSNFREALPQAEATYDIGRRIFSEDVESMSMLAFNYGWLLAKVGDNKQAEDILRDAVSLNEEAYGKEATELIPSLMQLGNVTAEPFNAKKQRRYYDRALKIASQQHGKDSAEYGRLSMDAGIQILNLSHSTDAKRYLQAAYKILRDTLGHADSTTGLAAFHLGRYQISRSRYRDSEEYLLAALSTFEDPSRPSSSIEMSANAWLVAVYEETGNPDKATAHCLAIGRMTPTTDNQNYVPLYKKAQKYPAVALSQNKEGYAVISFTVDQQGQVQDPELVEVSGGHSFIAPSLEVVKQFRYAPRFSGGEPVPTENVMQKISFRIAD